MAVNESLPGPSVSIPCKGRGENRRIASREGEDQGNVTIQDVNLERAAANSTPRSPFLAIHPTSKGGERRKRKFPYRQKAVVEGIALGSHRKETDKSDSRKDAFFLLEKRPRTKGGNASQF